MSHESNKICFYVNNDFYFLFKVHCFHKNNVLLNNFITFMYKQDNKKKTSNKLDSIKIFVKFSIIY